MLFFSCIRDMVDIEACRSREERPVSRRFYLKLVACFAGMLLTMALVLICVKEIYDREASMASQAAAGAAKRDTLGFMPRPAVWRPLPMPLLPTELPTAPIDESIEEAHLDGFGPAKRAENDDKYISADTIEANAPCTPLSPLCPPRPQGARIAAAALEEKVPTVGGAKVRGDWLYNLFHHKPHKSHEAAKPKPEPKPKKDEHKGKDDRPQEPEVDPNCNPNCSIMFYDSVLGGCCKNMPPGRHLPAGDS